MIRTENKEKRLFFCTDILVQKEEFNDCIFTDESTVRCERFLPKQFRRVGEPSLPKPKPKHPLSVHVCAGISKNGTTDIAIFTGVMDSSGYQTVMKEYLLPFISRAYPQGHRLVMDNDPKHRSKSISEWMKANKINHWPTPPESPDLNPIERLWAAMKYYIRRRVKPTKKEELTQGIREFWSTVTPVMCTRYINRMMTKLPILPCINYSLVCDLPIHTRSSANAEGPRAHCPLNLKSCKMLHKCPMDCIWKGLQPVNDFQCHSNDLQSHSRSLPLLPLDRPYTFFY